MTPSSHEGGADPVAVFRERAHRVMRLARAITGAPAGLVVRVGAEPPLRVADGVEPEATAELRPHLAAAGASPDGVLLGEAPAPFRSVLAVALTAPADATSLPDVLAVLAPEPHRFTEAHRRLLLDLARLEREAAVPAVVSAQGAEAGERWHTLVAVHPEPILITVDGRIRYINPSGVRVYGASTAEELIGRSVFDFLPADAHPLFEERKAMLERGVPTPPLEHTLIGLDGQERIIEVFSVPVQYQGQAAAQTVIRDVTARRRTEEALRQTERTLFSISENLAEGIYRSTPEGELLYVNTAFARLFGYESPAQLIGQKVPDLYDEPARRQALLEIAAQQGQVRNEEVRLVRRDGSRFWGLLNFSMTQGADGRWYYDGAITDITGRREAQEALQESEERWRRLVENHPEPLHISADGQILYMNPAGLQMLGASSLSEVVGRSVFDLSDPAEYDRVRERLAALGRGQMTRPAELTLRRFDGTRRTVEVISVPVTYRGRPAVQTVFRDVTERREYEQSLIEAREMAEEMNRLKSSFLANMSHEIRTPLTAIIGFADILAAELPDESREFVHLIRSSGERLMHTLNSVLDLAQLEGRGLTLHPEPVNVAAEVEEVLGLFRQQARQRGLDLHLDAPAEPIWARLDRGALSRVLVNLVSNAVKFTHVGGVTVVVRRLPEALVIEVRDTGIGIDPRFADRIFEEFRQESSGLARGYEGNGLGLTITRRLVELMQGTIELESEKGVGSTFTVRFPVPLESGPEGAPGPPAEARPRRPRVLVVEDNPEVQKVLGYLLRDDYDADLASGTEEALARMAETTYDALLIDINLGEEQTGVDLMQRLRRQLAGAAVPMIACTAYAMPGDQEQFLQLGFDAYLQKPLTREMLVQTLEAVLGGPAA